MSFLSKLVSFLMSLIIMLQSSVSLPVLSLNFRFDIEPAVFESGDDMYTVIWTTTRPGTGYITYTYDGVDYTVTDQVGGNIRTLDTVHAVRVPKKHLDNNEYTYHSMYVGTKQAYTAVTGKTVDSKPVYFNGYGGEDEVNALVLSDIHGNPGKAEKAASYFEEEPSLIILNGDIVSTMETKDRFLDILAYANMFSDGEIPVAYVRGNHEPRGEYAPEMLSYFRTTTGGLYYTFNYGPVWFISLDGGEDKVDSHPEYNGLVDFRAYIAEETKWLASVEPSDADYKVCLVHKPGMDDIDGGKWLGMLADLDIDAAVSGHLHRLDLHFYDGSVPYQRMVTGGESDEYGYIATMLTFADGNIRAVSRDISGNVRADETFAVK